MLGGVCALLSSVVAVGSGPSARAADLPSYFNEIVGTETASPAEIGTKNILQLNTTMFELYGDAGQVFKKNILAQHPLILGLFSGAGGRFILYRPGMAPIDAPPVPIVYQLLKSVAHSTMALGEVVVPYLNSPNDLTWRGSLAAYRDRMQSALDGLDATAMRGRLAAEQPQHSAEQHRVHGRVPEKQRDLGGCATGICQETVAATEEEHRLGGPDPGRSLDGCDRRLEADARRRLGQDVRGKQYDLRRPPEQRSVQCARAVFRAGGHQRPSDLDRDGLIHHDPRRHAGFARLESSPTGPSAPRSSATTILWTTS